MLNAFDAKQPPTVLKVNVLTGKQPLSAHSAQPLQNKLFLRTNTHYVN